MKRLFNFVVMLGPLIAVGLILSACGEMSQVKFVGSRVIQTAGAINPDGSVTLLPWYHLSPPLGLAPAMPTTTAGEYVIEAVDAVSRTLVSERFDLAYVDPSGLKTGAGFFGVIMPFPHGTAAFRIKHGEQVLRVVPVSPHSPTITITAPTAGQVISGSYTITWQSNDADGDRLYHRLEYTPDGQNWRALATNITQTQFVENFDNLPGGQQFRIRILVTDGVNTTEATSPPFVVPPKPPEVFITSPKPGARYMFGMNVSLSGRAYDDQDGGLYSEAALVWSSDRDGILGRGRSLNLETLSAGPHTITLSATNSIGLTGSASVTITIEAFAGTPSP